MKRIIYFIGILALVSTIMSCSKLELTPEDSYASGNFWQSEAQVKGYIYGLHSQLRGNSFTFWLMGEARGGLQKSGTSSLSTSLDYSSPIKDQDFTKDKTGVGNWGGFYNAILMINMGINKVEKECTFLSEANRQFYLGQLYGLRAYYYFWLYRTYGGVPIIAEPKVLTGITTAEPLYTERSTAKQTLDFIKADIKKSEDSFGANVTTPDTKSIWNKYATLMLKAEIYLWSAKVTTDDQAPAAGDINAAETALLQVKDKFSLQSDFTKAFSSSPVTNKGNSEIIFALRFYENEASNSASVFTYAAADIASKYDINKVKSNDPLVLKGTGILRNEYTFPFFQSFDDKDSRKTATFFDFYNLKNGVLTDGGLALKKFIGIINADGNRVYIDDLPVYRYADVLLMLAEVANKKGSDPSPYINEVRKRAYGTNYDAATYGYVNSTFAANELAILKERDKEFVWECKRWFDVVRMQDASGKSLAFSTDVTYGLGTPVIKLTEAYKLLWPINVELLNGDPKLKQTPGY